jgi:hypothetical protein
MTFLLCYVTRRCEQTTSHRRSTIRAGPGSRSLRISLLPQGRASRAAGRAAACGSPAPSGLAPSRAGDRGAAGLERTSTHECAATRTRHRGSGLRQGAPPDGRLPASTRPATPRSRCGRYSLTTTLRWLHERTALIRAARQQVVRVAGPAAPHARPRSEWARCWPFGAHRRR